MSSEPATAPRVLPEKAAQTTAEHPWPVRLLSMKIAQYISRMPPVWVEGQVVQLSRRPGASMVFLTLRDTDADMSLPVKIGARDLDGVELRDGAHVVVHAKPDFWVKNGTLSLLARELRPVGVGELLARIEHLKRVLAAEGLFDGDRKKPLPFLPRQVGLVCGRESKAEHDVVVNAHARWPALPFEIREVAVQGPNAVTQVCGAVAELDAHPEVDVIVIARGGGSVEDLLPFSNERLVRAVAGCRTPVVAAIGHETDTPLLDLVADYRASTPTDAARRIVPDVAEERHRVDQARTRALGALAARLRTEAATLEALRSRPVLAQPGTMLDAREEEVHRARRDGRHFLERRLDRAGAELAAERGRLRALSPAATLARGYAVLRTADGAVVRDALQVDEGERLEALLHAGHLVVEVDERSGSDPTTGLRD